MKAKTMEIDSERWGVTNDAITGIFVRAQDSDGGWHSADIWYLKPDSLLEWLRSDGGENPLAENTVGILLGRGHLLD